MDSDAIFSIDRCNIAIESMCEVLNTLGCTVAEALHAVRSIEHALEGMIGDDALAIIDNLENGVVEHGSHN